MANGDGFSIAVVCEADADRRTVCKLIDRVLCEKVDWITPELLDNYRQWRGRTDAEEFLRIGSVRSHAEKLGIQIFGEFPAEPRSDAYLARKTFLILVGANPQPRAVAFIRDTDNDLRRRDGCERARASDRWPFEILLGLPHTKRECWLLAAFDPTNESADDQLKLIHKELGFDPRLKSHQLTATGDQDKRSAKRVLHDLLGTDESCWDRADLRILRERGLQNGVADFINEIESRLIPHFTGRKP